MRACLATGARIRMAELRGEDARDFRYCDRSRLYPLFLCFVHRACVGCCVCVCSGAMRPGYFWSMDEGEDEGCRRKRRKKEEPDTANRHRHKQTQKTENENQKTENRNKWSQKTTANARGINKSALDTCGE